jgi:hypothetical protein
LVLTQSRCEHRWLSLCFADNNSTPRTALSSDWPAILAFYAVHALERSYEEDEDVNWSPWIQSWLGAGDENDPNNPKPPRPPSSYDPLELESLAKDLGSTSQLVQEALEARYRVFVGHQDLLGSVRAEQLYSVVLSRTAQLGPVWMDQDDLHGIIPLHDLCNHPPRALVPMSNSLQ